ncbi:hypothetical protein [Anaerobiospirillum sp. NML120449]|uniref:hypothetical protein n=1 Tax=Anaerobiospirillum sp. NML120449 TaxID=2932817 RepID=UPI001FF11FB2|nr:hypothetical protein [Anaerobiospirillum sp. NML120449]MCK0527494.1 hypothetical protein [Anaerobiospirillum sp. NML120449]
MKRKESRSWLSYQRSLHVLFSLEGMLGMSQQLVSKSSVEQPELYSPLLPQRMHGLQCRAFLAQLSALARLSSAQEASRCSSSFKGHVFQPGDPDTQKARSREAASLLKGRS